MNINIYLENKLSKQLDKFVAYMGKNRNMLIREAIKEWIEHHQAKQWPSGILKFKGLPNIVGFETAREELLSPKEDPLA